MNKDAKNKKRETIERRQQAEQNALIEQLKKTPIIHIACNKAGVGRSTFYRWIAEDDNFSKSVKDATHDGVEQINDMAEAQIINLIKNGNMRAIELWLRHHKDAYGIKPDVFKNMQYQEELDKLSKIIVSFIEDNPGTKLVRNVMKKNARRIMRKSKK